MSTERSFVVSCHRYTLLRLHGSGGMGQVWLARDLDLDREVALKELLPKWVDNPAVRSRFLHEARIVGQLEHTGIVPIYGVGWSREGRPFYVMKFVRGGTLAEGIAAYHRAPTAPVLRGLIRHFGDVCQAVAYAHSRGVIHRDLKPRNVMLGEYGETVVLDWGLARCAGRAEPGVATPCQPSSPGEGLTSPGPIVEEEGLTLPGQVLGTRPYMAPEQAEGLSGEVGPTADVYSLGVILHEIITGQPQPQPQVRHRVSPGDAVELIALKAMSPQPSLRHRTAAELVNVLQRWS